MAKIPEVPPEAMIGKDRNSQRIMRLVVWLRSMEKRGMSVKAMKSYLDELNRRLSSSKPARKAGVTIKAPRI